MNKQVAFRLNEELKNLAYECIKIRSIYKTGKPETFSDLIRNLLLEEWKRQKQKINTNTINQD